MIFMKFIFTACFGSDTFVVVEILIYVSAGRYTGIFIVDDIKLIPV